MSDPQHNLDFEALRTTILSWLESRISDDGLQWLTEKSNQIQKGSEDWEFFTSFSAVPRYTGKDSLNLTDEERKQAESLRKGWKPASWTADQLGRTLLVLSLAERRKEEFLDILDKTFISSDMGEAVALYQSLPVLPHPEELRGRAAEGIRSNITSAFNAVALRNPYPADYMDEDAWNQVVLKALFVGSPLYQIQGIDERANETLARMLLDYAHERRAAGRTVPPELWRPVGPFATGKVVDDLKLVLEQPDELNRQAAILALSASSSEEARQLLQEYNHLKEETEQAGVTWDDIGRRAEG